MMRAGLLLPTSFALALASAGGAASAQPITGSADAIEAASRREAREVLTLDEAAELLRVDPDVARKLAESAQLPARRVGDQWRFSRTALLDWLAGDAVPSRAPSRARAQGPGAPASPGGGMALTPTETAAIVGRGTAAADGGQDRTDGPIGEAPKERSASDVFLRDQRILLNPNELTLDVGMFYGRADDIVLTQAGTLAAVESDTFGGLALARYAVGRDAELFASLSYRDQTVSIFQGARRVSKASRSDFGDIGLGVRRTVVHEGPGRPDVILTVEGAVPTGSSSYALGGGLTFVKSFDPAVLYGTVDYRHTFSRDFADPTRLQPKERIDATIGYALALNDTLTVNTALTGTFTGRTSFEAATLRQSDTFSLLLGLTTRVSRTLYLQPSVSYRLNGPGNAVVFGLNIPYAFGR